MGGTYPVFTAPVFTYPGITAPGISYLPLPGFFSDRSRDPGIGH